MKCDLERKALVSARVDTQLKTKLNKFTRIDSYQGKL